MFSNIRTRFGVRKRRFLEKSQKNLVKICPRGVTVIDPPGGDSFLLDFFEIFQKMSFSYSKSCSDVRKHIPDTSRRSRRVQNTILISKTYFLDQKKRIFGKSDPASPPTDFPQTPPRVRMQRAAFFQLLPPRFLKSFPKTNPF